MDFGLIKSLGFWGPLVSADKKLTQPAGEALPEVPLINSDVYWHEAQHPVSGAQLLGTFKIDEPIIFKVPIAVDTDIAIRTIGRNARGLRTVSQVSEANPDLVLAGGLGGGSGVGQIRENHGWVYGVDLPPEKKLNFINAFKLRDDPTYEETDISTYGVPTGLLNLRTDKAASGVIGVTTGTIAAATLTKLTLAARLDLQPGHGVYIAGAGLGGGALITTVTLASENGLVLTLADPASAPVTAALVQADDTAAVQSWLAAKGDLAMPPGYYRLTSSISVPQATEGYSVVIHGAGWDLSVFAFQHHGDGFVPTGTLRADSIVMRDLTIGTGTIGDPNGTIDAQSQGHGVRMTAPSYSGIYNNFTLQSCRVIGWGRFGIWSDNLEVAWIENCIFRENGSGHIALVAPDDIETAKLPNANVLRSNAFDQAVSAGPSDSARTTTGSMTSGDTMLTASGFTAADRGKFVIVRGAGTNGGTLYTFIDVVVSSSQVRLAHQAQFPFSGSVEIAAQNVASILLHQAHDTMIDGATIQGNFAASDLGPATNVASDVNAIRAYKCDNLRIVGVHEEDNAGPGGAACRLENCRNVTIENWGGASASPPNFDNAHNSDFHLIACHGVRVSQSYFNDRPQFDIDVQSSEVEIDNSWVVGYINLWQQDRSPDRLRVGSGVRVQQSGDRALTNQTAGNEYMFDSIFGRDLLVNGRFLDGTGGMQGWTADPTASAYWSRTSLSLTRGGTFLNIDATAQPDSTVAKTVLHQTVAIPDTTGPGQFTLAFDWNIDFQSGIEFAGYFVEVRLHPSSGLDEALQFTTRRFTYVIDTWQVAQIRCWLGAGTGRTLDVQINVTPGVNNVAMHFANFRLSQGKHSWGAWERAVHDFGGTMRAPLEYVPIPAGSEASGGLYPPPAVGSPAVSVVNIAGSLYIGANGAYAPIGTGTGLTGRQSYLPKFAITGGGTPTALSDSSSLSENASTLYEQAHDFALDIGKKIYLGGDTLPQSQAMTWSNAGTPPVLFIGTPSGVAEIIEFLTGAQTPVGTGRFYIDGNWSRLTWNAQASVVNQSADGAAFYIAPQDTDDGVKVVMNAASDGLPFAYIKTGATVPLAFAVDAEGDAYLHGVAYQWPLSYPTSGSTVLTNNGAGILTWAAVGTTGAVITGLPYRVAMFNAGGNNVVEAPAIVAPAGTPSEFALIAVGLRLERGRVVNSLYGASAYCELITLDTDDVIKIGPTTGPTGIADGATVVIRAGRGDAQGLMTINGSQGRLTFNEDPTAPVVTGNVSMFYARIVGLSTHGLTLKSPETSGYTGNYIQCLSVLTLPKFVVEADGNLAYLRGRHYNWPTAHLAGVLTNDGSGGLSWGAGGAVITGLTNLKVPRWDSATSKLVDSTIEDRTSTVGTIEFKCNQYLAQRLNTDDRMDCYIRTGTTPQNAVILRYEHDPLILSYPANTAGGELQFFLNGSIVVGGNAVPNVFFGDRTSWFQSALRIRPYTSAETPLEIWSPGAGLSCFTVQLDGNLAMIRGQSYVWPNTLPSPNTGVKLLQLNTVDRTLSWVPPPSSTSPVTGRQYYIPIFDGSTNLSDTSQLYQDALALHVGGTLALDFVGQPAASGHYTGGGVCSVFSMGVSSPTTDHLFFGPSTPTSGAWVKLRAGSAAPKGYFSISGASGYFGLNANDSEMTSTTLRIFIPALGDNGIIISPRLAGTFTGYPFYYANQAGTELFSVFADGGLSCIRGRNYTWPNSTPVTAGVTRVLGYTTQTTLNDPVTLSWVQLTGGGVSGTATHLARFATSSTLGDSAITEDTALLRLGFNTAPVSPHAFLFRPNGNDNGIVVIPAGASTGSPFYYQDASNLSKFGVNSAGDLYFIKNVAYLWPSAIGVTNAVLTITNAATGQLGWQLGGGSGANTFLSNLAESNPADHSTSQVAVNTWILPATNADSNAANAINLGSPSKKFNAAYFYSGVFVYPVGSSSASPRSFGFIPADSTAGNNSGQCSAFLLFGGFNAFQAGDDARFQIAAHRSIELHGNRNITTFPAYSLPYTREAIFNANRPSVFVLQDGDVEGLWINSVGFSGTKAKLRVQQASADVLVIGADGDLDVIKSMPYTWPTGYSAGVGINVLANDGAGLLTWRPWPTGTGSGITGTGTNLANYLTKWVTANSTVTNSTITDDGTVVTVNARLAWTKGTKGPVRIWQPFGGFGGTTTETLNPDQETIICDTYNGGTGATLTMNLPDAATHDGRRWHIIMLRRDNAPGSTPPGTATNKLTFNRSGSDLINNMYTTITLDAGLSGQRDVFITADGQLHQWWISPCYV